MVQFQRFSGSFGSKVEWKIWFCGGDDSSPAIQEITSTIRKLSLDVDTSDLLYERTRDEIEAVDMSRWFTIESDEPVQIGMVDVAMTATNGTMQAEYESSTDSEEDDFEQLQPLPPTEDICAMFQDLECEAMNSHVDSAIIHVRRASPAFLAAKRKKRTPETQLLITAVLSNES